jgi:uncharacterized protein YbaR (Trm112 family)
MATTPDRGDLPLTLHPLLLEVLVCPDCKGALTHDATSNELVCDDCGLVYPIRDGIPIMLVSAARRPHADDGEGDDHDVAETPGDEAAVEPSDD